jgi:hypothetical protein
LFERACVRYCGIEYYCGTLQDHYIFPSGLWRAAAVTSKQGTFGVAEEVLPNSFVRVVTSAGTFLLPISFIAKPGVQFGTFLIPTSAKPLDVMQSAPPQSPCCDSESDCFLIKDYKSRDKVGHRGEICPLHDALLVSHSSISGNFTNARRSRTISSVASLQQVFPDLTHSMSSPGSLRSDTEQSQPRKRQRIERACARCKARKIKCDAKQPACSRCETVDVECVYGQVGRRGKGKTL